MKHYLSKNQAKRLGVEKQEVIVELRKDSERPPCAIGRMAKHVWSLTGERLGGALSLNDKDEVQ